MSLLNTHTHIIFIFLSFWFTQFLIFFSSIFFLYFRIFLHIFQDNDYTNENFTDSSNRTNEEETESDGNNSLQYQTIIHFCIISMSLVLSSITIILLLHLLCFHLFLSKWWLWIYNVCHFLFSVPVLF